jgi:hypothetical protein
MIQSIILFVSGALFGGIIVGIKYGDTIYKMFLSQQALLNEIESLNIQIDCIKKTGSFPSVN